MKRQLIRRFFSKDLMNSQNSQQIIEQKLTFDKEQIKKLGDIDDVQQVLKEIDKPIQIDVTKYQDDKMISNPLKNSNYIETNKSHIKTEIDQVLRFNENQLASKILAGEKFDLNHPEIKLQKNTLSQLNNQSDLSSINLGHIKALNKNTIFIDDVDVSKIPKFLDIDLKGEDKEIIIIGKKINNGETNELEVVHEEAFVERTLDEDLKKSLNLIDHYFRRELNLKFWFFNLKILPLLLFIYYLIETELEYKRCIESVYKIEQSKIEKLKELQNNYI